MDLEEKTLESKTLYSGRVIKLTLDKAKLPNGAEASREVVMHPGGVCVAALTDKDEVLCVRQYRYPYHRVLLEIPAGKRDVAGEEPLECGIRELKEETGASAEQFISLGTLFPSPGYCDEVIYMYAASGLSYGESDPDEDEFVQVEKIPLDTLVEMILNGEVTDAKTQTAVLKLYMLKQQGEI